VHRERQPGAGALLSEGTVTGGPLPRSRGGGLPLRGAVAEKGRGAQGGALTREERSRAFLLARGTCWRGALPGESCPKGVCQRKRAECRQFRNEVLR